MVSYTLNASFVYVGKGSNPLKTHHRDVHHSGEYWISSWVVSTQFSMKSIETNHIYFKSIKHRLPYFITHKLINLNWFSIYQLLLLYSTQIYNAFFLTLLLWNVLLRTPKFMSTKSFKIKFFSYTNNTGSITHNIMYTRVKDYAIIFCPKSWSLLLRGI